MRTKSLIALTLGAGLVAGCPSSPDASHSTEAPASEQAPDDQGTAAAEAPADEPEAQAAVEPAAEPEAEPEAEHVAMGPETPIAMSGVRCTFEGGQLIPNDDGNGNWMSLFVHGNHLYSHMTYSVGEERRSDVQKWAMDLSDTHCTLTRDDSFAGDGQLEVASGWGITAVGDRLVAEAGDPRLFTLDGQPLEGECEFNNGYVITDGQGNAWVGVNEFRPITFTENGCTVGEPTHNAGERQWDPAYLDGDIVSRRSGDNQGVVRMRADGTEVWRATAVGEGDTAREMSFLSATAEVGGRILVGPTSDKAVVALSPTDGSFLGLLDLEARPPAIEGWPRATVKMLVEHDDTHFFIASSAFTPEGLQRGVVYATISAAE